RTPPRVGRRSRRDGKRGSLPRADPAHTPPHSACSASGEQSLPWAGRAGVKYDLAPVYACQAMPGQELRFGVGVWQGYSTPRLIELARLIEDEGFDQLWYSNHKLYRDMWAGMAVTAMSTRRIELGTFVAEPYSQHPAQIAAAIATIDELSGGRAILGL